MKNKLLSFLVLIILSVSAIGATNIPNNAVPLKPLKKGGQIHYVVLPPGFERSKVIIADSPEYQKLLSENKKLKEQSQKDNNTFDEFKKTTDKTLLEKAAQDLTIRQELIKVKADNQRKTFWNWILGFTSVLFPLGAIGLAILCVMNPGVIVVVFQFLGGIINVIISWISFIISGFKNIANKIVSYKKDA